MSKRENWIEKILAAEREAYRNFFSQEFDLTKLEKVLQKCGPEKIKQWRVLGELHFLPDIAMPREAKFPGWKKKPELWYYNQVAAGKILRRQPDGKLKAVKKVKSDGIVVLIDTRLKPPYDNGRQMFKDDNLLGSVVEKLRKEGKITDYSPQASRFGISATEEFRDISPILRSLDGEFQLVRSETVIEANVIPQLYPHMPRRKDGQTSTWVWYEEYFGGASGRLNGGSSDYGGLADVNWDSVGDRWSRQAFRPLVVLS